LSSSRRLACWIVVCGVALAADLRGAMGRYLNVATCLAPRMEPRTWARLQSVVMAVIGSIWLVDSIA